LDSSGEAAEPIAAADAAAEPTAAAGEDATPACAEPPTRYFDSRIYESFNNFAVFVLGHRGDIRDSY
jgi:hypothetical protein